MTWIKPSFLWLMQRSNWASKSGQERILAVRISRQGWEQALRLGSLTSFTPAVHAHVDAWRTEFSQSQVHVQWDPERSLRGKKLEHRSLQVGISRHLIRNYVEHWIQEITDYTSRVKKIRQLCLQGDYSRANRLLPPERGYELPDDLAQRLAMTTP
ncbi:hypothetical protein Pan181_20940 [Aeoliella mucimassa]|uniref:DUF4291 domain-containing protein n=1 Tax=Aeoliella mucimassa TaxID=2527972 RepID=A0A518AMH1_9BACT|nr:hypothetical protein Pan181_20940 [Aeoliella mucimassa]